MKQVRLIGKTKHGKDRIRQHGDVWDVVSVDKRRGQLTFHLRSIHKTMGGFADGSREHDGRWVQCFNDPNFDIVHPVCF